MRMSWEKDGNFYSGTYFVASFFSCLPLLFQEIDANPLNYDAWFDFLRLMETECDSLDEIRDSYERAIANVPPLAEKRSWRRYIYLWINYAIFEELQAKVEFYFILFGRTGAIKNHPFNVFTHN